MAYMTGYVPNRPYPLRGQTSPSQQIHQSRLTQPPMQRPDLHVPPIASNPLFGRPAYLSIRPQGVIGPALAGNYRGGTLFQPPRQMGTGQTSKRVQPGTQATLPGYVASQTDYQPNVFEYAPHVRTSFVDRIPATLALPGGAQDGVEMVGTYRAHDFTAGAGDQRFNHQMRSAPNWQVMAFPPDYRILIQRQQVMKYQTQSLTRLARPLRQTDYFLGYVTQPSVAAQIDGNTLGVMGSF